MTQALASISDGHRMSLMSAGVLDALLTNVELSSDLMVLNYALKALADMSMNETVRQEVKIKGYLPHLMNVLATVMNAVQQNSNSTPKQAVLDIIHGACAALSAQANNDQSKVAIRESQGIPLLINALRTFPEDEEIQLQVCLALANLSFDPASRFAILTADGIGIICHVLSYRPPAKVVLASMRAVAHVSRVDEALARFDNDDISAVVDNMSDDPEDEKNMWACQALSNLSAGTSGRNQVLKAGAAEALCNLLVKGNGMHKRATNWAAIALSNLSSQESCKVTIEQQKAVKPLMQLLNNIVHSPKDETLLPLLKLMSSAASLEGVLVTVYECQGAQLMMRIVQSGVPDLLKPGLYGLSVICNHPPAQSLLAKDANVSQMIISLLDGSDDISALAACILAKLAQSEEGAESLAKDHILEQVFRVIELRDKEKAAAWLGNCVSNICRKLGERLLLRSPDVLVNIMSVLLKSSNIDVIVWLEGSLAELSKHVDGVKAIVEMNGITLMAQFISTSTDDQCIEMAGYVLKNLASKEQFAGEFRKQGAIRPLVHLLRVSLEKNDLENTNNVVRCIEHISVNEENATALRHVSWSPPKPPSPEKPGAVQCGSASSTRLSPAVFLSESRSCEHW